MPEGPEVFALAYAIQKYGLHCESYGKHLFINNSDLSFGLIGKVKIVNGIIEKNTNHWRTGYNRSCTNISELIQNNKLGVNLLTTDLSTVLTIVNNWQKSKKKLALLLLDQSQIAGIGVAWGSEICNLANLRPELPAKEQDLSKLAQTIIFIRDNIRNLYQTFVDNSKSNEIFINEWFDNLYTIRNMTVYKKGKSIEISNRNWWISP